MSERSSRKKRRDYDFSVTAFRVVQDATKDEETVHAELEQAQAKRHEAAVLAGRLGGKKGGRARAAKLTPEQRKEIAREAVEARWARMK